MKMQTSIVGELSGSLGGVTASHNRGGTYLRRRRIPVNPNSNRQQNVRADFGSMVSVWTNELTPTQRELWNVYAAAIPRVDSLGNTYTITGQQCFIGVNTVRLHAALTLIEDAPTVFDTGTPAETNASTFQNADGDVLLGGPFAGGASAAGTMLLYIGRAQNLSRTFYKGPYQLAAKTPVTSGGANWSISENITDPTWLSDYPVPVGMLLPVRTRVSYNDGRLSQAAEYLLPIVDPT